MPVQHTCAHGKCTNEVALSSRYCPEHGSAQIWFLYHLLDNRIRHCVQWPFTRLKTGYGVINTKFTEQASRYACAILHGLPPANFLVGAHNCGNGHEGCVNPYHLRWATAQENANDRVLHERQRAKYGKTIAGRLGPMAVPTIVKDTPVKALAPVLKVAATRPVPAPSEEWLRHWREYYATRPGPHPLAVVEPELYLQMHRKFEISAPEHRDRRYSSVSRVMI